jgi:hypothetical protein
LNSKFVWKASTPFTNVGSWDNRVTLAVGRPLPIYSDQQTFLLFVGVSQRRESRKRPDLTPAGHLNCPDNSPYIRTAPVVLMKPTKVNVASGFLFRIFKSLRLIPMMPSRQSYQVRVKGNSCTAAI